MNARSGPPPFHPSPYGAYDTSRYQHTPTTYNTAFTSSTRITEHYSYNGVTYLNYSYALNGSSEYVVFPVSGVLAVGYYTNFTIEAWFKFEEKAGIGTIISNWGGTAAKRQYALRVQNNNTLTFHWAPYSTTSAICTSGALTPGVWYHVAVTRSGSTFRLFVNGTQVSSGTSSAYRSDSNTTQVGRIVTTSATNYFKGYIDEIRVTSGVARYTGNFTPPTKQFPMQ
jgi:hypothetical protein